VKIRNNGKYINLCDVKQIGCDYNSFKRKLQAAVVDNPSVVCGNSKNKSNEKVAVLIE
jgi:hypothetical protein